MSFSGDGGRDLCIRDTERLVQKSCLLLIVERGVRPHRIEDFDLRSATKIRFGERVNPAVLVPATYYTKRDRIDAHYYSRSTHTRTCSYEPRSVCRDVRTEVGWTFDAHADGPSCS